MTIHENTPMYGMMNGRSNVWDDSILCSQCMSSYPSRKTKPIYEESGVICGRICDYCRMSNVENARKCQLKRCVSSDRVQSLRTLPAKFYDLAPGQSKLDIISQFGIHKDTKACCNTCYLRISRAAQKAKIFVADFTSSVENNISTSENIKDASSNLKENTNDNKSAAESETSEDTGYTGPQFRRKEGLIPFWLKHKFGGTKLLQENSPKKDCVEKDSGITDTEEEFLYDIEGNESDIFDSSKDDNYIPPSEHSVKPSRSPPKTRSRAVKKPSRYSEDVSDFILDEDDVSEGIPKVGDAASVSRSMAPKEDISRKEDTASITSAPIPILSTSVSITPASIPVLSALIPVTLTSNVITSTVSNICSTCPKGYARPVSIGQSHDQQGNEFGLCKNKTDARNKTSNQRRQCPVRGCTTPANELHLGILPARYFSLSRAHKKTLVMKFGLPKNAKTCCKNCFPKIKTFVKECCDMRDITYTMCQSCQHVVPEHSTTSGLDGGGNPIVKCFSCCKELDHPNTVTTAGGCGKGGFSTRALKISVPNETDSKKTNVEVRKQSLKIVDKSTVQVDVAKTLLNFNQSKQCINGALGAIKPNNISKLFNLCAVKGCVSTGHWAWLYPLDDILRHCPKPLLKEVEEVFSLTEGCHQHGCRSCFNQIKWYVAYKTNCITTHIETQNVPILPRPPSSHISFTTSITTHISFTTSITTLFTTSATKSLPEKSAILFPIMNKIVPITETNQHASSTCVNIYPKYPVVGTVFSLTSAPPTLIQSISNTIPSTCNDVISTVPNPIMLAVPHQSNNSRPVLVPKPHQDGPKLLEVVSSGGKRLNPLYLSTFDTIQLPATTHSTCVRRIQPKPIQPRLVFTSDIEESKLMSTASKEANFTQHKWKLNITTSTELSNPSVKSISTEGYFKQEKWKLKTNVSKPEDAATETHHAMRPDTSRSPSMQTPSEKFVGTNTTSQQQTTDGSYMQQKEKLTGFNKNETTSGLLPLKLDKVCQAGLAYYTESGDGCCSITLKQPFSMVRDNKIRTAVMKEAKDMFDSFMRRLNTLTLDCGKEVLAELVNSKDFQNTLQIKSMLYDYGELYRQTDRQNKQERLRVLSSVALYASNDQIRQNFRRLSNKGDVINVDEDEIKRARDYAKMFGPGMPLPNVSGDNVFESKEEKVRGVRESLLRGSRLETKRPSGKHPIEVITIDDMDDGPPPIRSSSDKGQKRDVIKQGLPGYFVTVESKLVDSEKEEIFELKKLANMKTTVVSSESIDVITSSVPVIDKEEILQPMSPVYDGSVYSCSTRTNSVSSTHVKSSDNIEASTSKLSRTTVTSLKSDVPVSSNGLSCNINPSNVHQKPACDANVSATSTCNERSRQDVHNDCLDVQVKPSENEAAKREGSDVRRKRKRTIFSQEEKDQLEAFYLDSIFHGKTRKMKEMQDVLNLDRRTIHTWFRNRRFREKKDAFGRKLKQAASEMGKEMIREKSETDESHEDSMASCSDEETRLSEAEKADE